jgi:N-acetylglucosaminyl-diphospho-decaprenol L-rhamnosyltransferase
MPLVSIIIVSYNCEDLIADCVRSCLGVANTEVIVIDNGSKDRSPEILADFGGQIRFLREPVNHGFTQGCNLGIDQAKGEFIFLLNPDAALFPDSVERMLAYFENPRVGAVAPTLVYADHTFQNYTRTFPTICGLAVESFVPSKWRDRWACYRRYLCLDVDFSRNQQVEQPAGAAILFRNQLRLDETYFIYGSDVELCKNIIDKGLEILQVTDARVLHHQSQGGTGDGNPRLKMFLQLDNFFGMQVFFRRYRSAGYVWAYRAVFFAILLLIAVFSVFRGRAAASLKFKRLWYFARGVNFRTYLQSSGL